MIIVKILDSEELGVLGKDLGSNRFEVFPSQLKTTKGEHISYRVADHPIQLAQDEFRILQKIY